MGVKERSQCHARMPVESDSYISRWIFRNQGNIDYFDPTTLFHTLEETGINKILFVGDSMTEQTFNFFVCDISRLRNTTIFLNDEFSLTVTINGITISFERIKSHLSSVIGFYYQNHILDEELHKCIDKLFLEMYLKGSVSRRTLLLFNQGLHIKYTNNTD